jgi:hypothetical protein
VAGESDGYLTTTPNRVITTPIQVITMPIRVITMRRSC